MAQGNMTGGNSTSENMTETNLTSTTPAGVGGIVGYRHYSSAAEVE